MMNKTLIALLISFSLVLNVNAQEYLSGFNHGQQHSATLKKHSSENALTLPFFDDFTETHIVTDASKWQNSKVLVNSGFPLYPTNYNAATFDVLNEFGAVYSNGSSNPFIADSLISNPIRLVDENGNKLTPADSLYFSFYYQPQGSGDAPEINDSLVLRFGCVIDTFRIEYDTLFIRDVMGYMGVDTIYEGDIIYHDYMSSCNLDMYTYAERQYTAVDSNVRVAIPCDTVFYSEMQWDHIWSTEGMTLDSFMLINDNQYFKQVMIPVKKASYFENDFVILFYNYGSLPTTMYPNDRSNVDNWNIDFVYLDKNRSFDDVTYPMLTFSQKSPSLLKRYTSMPYRQYLNNPTVAMIADYQMFVANLSSEDVEAEYSCSIERTIDDWFYQYSGPNAMTFSPYHTFGMNEFTPHLNNFLFDLDETADSASFQITHFVKVVDESSDVKGDTLYGYQGFYNYYSYDDGIPEMGYGVVPDESYFASQFSISTVDTLCGVQLLFNRTFNNANYDFFDIVVWNDNFGKPGNEIYRLENQRPKWDDNLIYKFAYYRFDEIIKVNGIIYVGIMQHNKESINIGFDTSVDNHQYNFFETGNGWQNSMMKGSLMIRPVVGRNYYISTEENYAEDNKLVVYPNPASNIINISNLDAELCDDIKLYDMTGRLLNQYKHQSNIDVSDLSNGLYLMRVTTSDNKFFVGKFMISR